MTTKKLKFMMVALGVLLSIHANATYIDGINYRLNVDDKTAEVTKDSYYSSYSGHVPIPSSVIYKGETYSVTSIGKEAFYFASGLTSVTIPNSVTSIGAGAFHGCSGLTSLTIPNSVTSIGSSAFSGCSGLTSITIPNSVTSIGGFAFSGCSGLTSITIPESVTSIGGGAFWGTPWYDNQEDGLVYAGNVLYKYKGTMPDNTVIDIKDGTVSISSDAFYNCNGLTSVTIPNSVTSIGSSAFSGCSGLTSVTTPNSVTSIGYEAFSGCSGLTSVTVNWNRPLANGAQFDGNVKQNATLYVPKGTAMMYMAAEGWSQFVNIQEFEDGEDVHYITIRMGDGGVLKQSVEVGNTYTYAVSADEGWEVSTLTFDGKDMTSLLLDGQFSTPVITGNSELNVVFGEKGNSVKERSEAPKVKVYASNNAITVAGADGNAAVNVYSTNGILVKSSFGNVTLPLESGVYIVKVGKETFKVAL